MHSDLSLESMPVMAHSTTPTSSNADCRLHLLTLPYDIRYLVYKHLFPQMSQVYLMSNSDGLNLMHSTDYLPLSLLSTCSQLHDEAAGYLWNNYLFNIIGYKKHCMAHYGLILEQLDKYARTGPKIDVLDNGRLSSTACVCMYAKDGHVAAMARNRRRGVRRVLREVEDEAAAMPAIPRARTESWQLRLAEWFILRVINADLPTLWIAVTATAVAIIAAVWIAVSKDMAATAIV